MKKIVTLTARIVLGVVLGAGSLAAAGSDPTMPAGQAAYAAAIKRAKAVQARLAAVKAELHFLDDQYNREVETVNQGRELSDERVRWYRVQSQGLQALRDDLQAAVGCLALIPVSRVASPVEVVVNAEGVVTQPTHEAYTTVVTPSAEHPGAPATDDQAPVAPAPEPTLVDRWLASPWTTVLYGAAGAVAYAATTSATGVQRVMTGFAGGIASAALLKAVAACRRNRINHAHEA